MMVNFDGQLLDDSIAAAQASGLAPLAGLARGPLPLHDHDAVRNRLTLPRSSGTCEGNANRIKMTKRQMYGRANFGLLRVGAIHNH